MGLFLQDIYLLKHLTFLCFITVARRLAAEMQTALHLVCLTKCLLVFAHLWVVFKAGARAIVEYARVYLHIVMAEWAWGSVMNQGLNNKPLM